MPSIAHLVMFNRDLSYANKEALLEMPSVTWLPLHAMGKTFEDVPEHIAAPANEAYTSHSVGAYQGAIMLARAVVEATAKAQGRHQRAACQEDRHDVRARLDQPAH